MLPTGICFSAAASSNVVKDFMANSALHVHSCFLFQKGLSWHKPLSSSFQVTVSSVLVTARCVTARWGVPGVELAQTRWLKGKLGATRLCGVRACQLWDEAWDALRDPAVLSGFSPNVCVHTESRQDLPCSHTLQE